MAKVSPMQEAFNSGELSTLLNGRVSIDRYKSGMALCQNYIPTVQGPVYRRPGTKFVREVKTSSSFTRLVEFEFSVTQAYILEFGNLYVRFYKDYGQIVDGGGAAIEVVTPYTTAQLPDLRFAQSADTLFIVHPSHKPRRLSRTSHTVWNLEDLRVSRFTGGHPAKGPFIEVNDSATTMTPSATSGTITLTASSVTGVNGGAGFRASDVGRCIRIAHTGTWGLAYITNITSTTVVDATVSETFGASTGSVTWRFGLYNDTDGWPSCVSFHEDRLVLGGAASTPQRFDGSNIGDYGNFNPSDASGTITSANAYSFTLNSGDVNNIRWIKSDEKGMPIGTVAGEWVVRPSNSGEAISPTNVNAKRLSAFGSANIDAVQLGKATIFAQRTKRKLRELTYFYEVDGFKAQDMTQLAEHFGQTGFKEFKAQREPQPMVWACREDGLLCSMTYEREDGLQAAWARHPLGGRSDANNTSPIVESLAVIPSPSGDTYDVWMIVRRWIDGASVRYIEYMTSPFTSESEQEDAFFVDSGLTYYSPLTITNITQANPAVVTSNGHGLSNGNAVKLFDVVGMTDVNLQTYTVANVTANTFELSGINSSLFNAYVSGGEIRKFVTTISGLDHLEGEIVNVFGDGASQPTRTVTAGAITLATAATKVHVGLGNVARGKLLRLDVGAQDGTAIGKTRRIHNVTFMLERTLGLKIGTNFSNLTPMKLTSQVDLLSSAPGLYSGMKLETLDANYDTENQICFEQTDPMPGTILAIMPQLQVQDR